MMWEMTAERAPGLQQLGELEREIARVKATLAEVEEEYDSVTGQLVQELEKMANLDVTSKPDELREAANRLRRLEVRSLDLQLHFDKLEMHTEAYRNLLQSLEPSVVKVAAKEISDANDFIATADQRVEYFAHAEAKQSEFFHRMAETISLAYSQLKESNDREFQNRIAKYGAWIAAAVAILSAATILIEIIKLARGLG